jgi:hypothetical protein
MKVGRPPMAGWTGMSVRLAVSAEPMAVEKALVVIADALGQGSHHPKPTQLAVDMEWIEMMLQKPFDLAHGLPSAMVWCLV